MREEQKADGRIQSNMRSETLTGSERVSVKKLSTYGGEGCAEVWYPQSAEEFADALCAIGRMGKEPYILGGGSNTLICGDGAPIVCTRRMRSLCFDSDRVLFEAGATISQLMTEARKRGFGGMEFLEGVPATLGGALRMNAGAFGFEMSDFAICTRILTKNGQILLKPARSFPYRQGETDAILGGELKLFRMRPEESLSRREEFLARRRAKQPRQPSLGSVFKNIRLTQEEAREFGVERLEQIGAIRMPKNREVSDGSSSRDDVEFRIPAGKLVDMCGLKGTVRGGAQISPMHANFIVNLGRGTAEDYLSLVRLAENAVFDRFGLKLEREFALLGRTDG